MATGKTVRIAKRAIEGNGQLMSQVAWTQLVLFGMNSVGN